MTIIVIVRRGGFDEFVLWLGVGDHGGHHDADEEGERGEGLHLLWRRSSQCSRLMTEWRSDSFLKMD